jgi:hypothetical protein
MVLVERVRNAEASVARSSVANRDRNRSIEVDEAVRPPARRDAGDRAACFGFGPMERASAIGKRVVIDLRDWEIALWAVGAEQLYMAKPQPVQHEGGRFGLAVNGQSSGK